MNSSQIALEKLSSLAKEHRYITSYTIEDFISKYSLEPEHLSFFLKVIEVSDGQILGELLPYHFYNIMRKNLQMALAFDQLMLLNKKQGYVTLEIIQNLAYKYSFELEQFDFLRKPFECKLFNFLCKAIDIFDIPIFQKYPQYSFHCCKISNSQIAFERLLLLAKKQGCISSETIRDFVCEYSLGLKEFSFFRKVLKIFGIPTFREAFPYTLYLESSENEKNKDSFDIVCEHIIKSSPSLKPIIEYIKNIQPLKTSEINQIKRRNPNDNHYIKFCYTEKYLRLALEIAVQKAELYDIDLEEAISAAFMGVVLAIDEKGPDFSGGLHNYVKAYINETIKNELLTVRAHFDSNSTEKIRKNYLTMYPAMKKRGCFDCDELYRCQKASNMVCDRLCCSESTTQKIVISMVPNESIDQIIEKRAEQNGYDGIEDVDVGELLNGLIPESAYSEDALYDIHELRDTIKDVLTTLTPMEQKVIKLRFGLFYPYNNPLTLEKVAYELSSEYYMRHYTRERIRQIEAKALRKLRHPSRSKRLKDFLD